ncbi:MAG: hypothetical protein ABIP93_20560 [Gemmatimonadaceae bacterium]
MSRLLTGLLVVLFTVPEALPGQAAASAASIRPGARVRITQAGQQPRVAMVVTRSADTLLVRWPELANTVAVPLAEIYRLEFSNGRHRKVVKGMALGTLSLGTAGALLGAAASTPCTSSDPLGCFLVPVGRNQSALMGGAVGGVLGLVVGALWGLPIREDWRQVQLDAPRVAVALAPRGGAPGIGVSLRF